MCIYNKKGNVYIIKRCHDALVSGFGITNLFVISDYKCLETKPVLSHLCRVKKRCVTVDSTEGSK